jgi:hypothetical protein
LRLDCISSPFMFARRVIDVRSEVWSAPLPYLDIPWSRLFLSVPSVNLKLT